MPPLTLPPSLGLVDASTAEALTQTSAAGSLANMIVDCVPEWIIYIVIILFVCGPLIYCRWCMVQEDDTRPDSERARLLSAPVDNETSAVFVERQHAVPVMAGRHMHTSQPSHSPILSPPRSGARS
ncbi:hypothetical protein FB45DRAFT_867799 [Roridomyces roridus]|uniref:Uncharacterized protein n=1 Tax=Roridomyces roridus TaxID=1738132 RepID=A0AAD7FMZ1_9AGAR|nr:hypothetical protein FB45DRAFT_867799 [Roridomyces roridus]